MTLRDVVRIAGATLWFVALACAQEHSASGHFVRGKQLIEANCGECMGGTRKGLEEGIAQIRKAIDAGYHDQVGAYKLLAYAYNELAIVYAGKDPKEQKEFMLLQKEALEKVIALNPGDAQARVQYGRVIGDRKMMIAAFRELVAANPSDTEARYGLAIYLIDDGQIDDGVAQLKKSLELADPHSARTYADNGRAALLEKGRKAEAAEIAKLVEKKKQTFLLSKQTLVRLSELKPGDARIQTEYARAVEDPEKKIGALQDIVAAYPNDALAKFSLGMALVYNAQFGEGVMYFRGAIESADLYWAQIYGRIAQNFLVEQGRQAEAAEIASLTKKKKQKPN